MEVHTPLASTLLVIAGCFILAGAQQNGDVRLVGSSLPRRGRVELLLDGTWGTVAVSFSSSSNVRRYAADAICKQLGFPGSTRNGNVGDLSVEVASSAVPRVISNLFCGREDTSTDSDGDTTTTISDAENLHILRCDYSKVIQALSSPNHNNDFAVECRAKSDDGYDTEVRLVQGKTGFSSSGFVEIYLHNSWGPVCNMGARDADSACRQLGYTNAASVESDNFYMGDDIAKVSNFSCTSSRQCLKSCFNYPPNTNVSVCSTVHSIIECTYVVSDEHRFSSGNEFICTGLQLIVGLALGLTFLFIVLTVAAILVTVFLCCRYRRRRGGCREYSYSYHYRVTYTGPCCACCCKSGSSHRTVTKYEVELREPSKAEGVGSAAAEEGEEEGRHTETDIPEECRDIEIKDFEKFKEANSQEPDF